MYGIAFANLVESTTDPQAFYYNLAVLGINSTIGTNNSCRKLCALTPFFVKKTPLQLSNDLTFHRSCRWKVVDWNKLPMTICQQHPGKLREMAYFGAWEPSRGAGLLICTLPQHICAGFKPFASDTFGRLMVAGRDQMWRYPQNLLWSSLVYAPKHFSCSIFRWLNPANCSNCCSQLFFKSPLKVLNAPGRSFGDHWDLMILGGWCVSL